jgi:hypothetical protein
LENIHIYEILAFGSLLSLSFETPRKTKAMYSLGIDQLTYFILCGM